MKRRILSFIIPVPFVKMPTIRFMADWAIYKALRKKNPYMMIALCGCMMQEPTVVEKTAKQLSVCGSDFWNT